MTFSTTGLSRHLLMGGSVVRRKHNAVTFAAAVLALFSVAAVASASGSSHAAPTTKDTTQVQLYPYPGDDWTMSMGSLSGLRHSSLDQINTSNVKNLKVAWTQSLYPTKNYSSLGVESTPIEADGVMYVPSTRGVDALDATTGKIKWQFKGAPNKKGLVGNLLAARALSMGDGMVFTGEADGSISALNQTNGHVIWSAAVASVGTYAKKTKPISIPFTVYANGVVLTGINGGDTPLRGHIDAYNAKTGKLIWRWFTLPDLNDVEISTWSNPAEAATGGAAIWSIPAVDSTLNRAYVGTGNPFPYTGRGAGKGLWADSEVSLDLKTGALKWGYQGVHHDEWDYDCPTPPVLYNATVKGKMVPGIAFSCKSGYIYLLDRRNGKPIFPIPEVAVPNLDAGVGAKLNQTWPTQPIPTGGSAQILPHCPTVAQVKNVMPGKWPNAPNGDPYVLTCPYAPTNATHYALWGPYFAFGGTDYPPMAYNPTTNDLYVCANVSWQSMENLTPKSQSHRYATGGGWTTVGESGTVSALNVSTNKLDWQVKYQGSNDGACYSGVLSTAGGLVFVSSRGQTSGVPKPFGGKFYAYNAKTGKQLFMFKNKSLIMAPAITYAVNGKQYIAVAMTAGTSTVNLPGFGALTTSTKDRLVVFSL